MTRGREAESAVVELRGSLLSKVYRTVVAVACRTVTSTGPSKSPLLGWNSSPDVVPSKAVTLPEREPSLLQATRAHTPEQMSVMKKIGLNIRRVPR
ncbi:MAG: hypothetical protein QM784_15010 [Polyangiaceae bacterium]